MDIKRTHSIQTAAVELHNASGAIDQCEEAIRSAETKIANGQHEIHFQRERIVALKLAKGQLEKSLRTLVTGR